MLGEIFLNAAVADALMPGIGKVTAGGCIGYAMGYALKKTLKIMLIFLGIFVFLATILASQNMIVINWEVVQMIFQNLLDKHDYSLTSMGEQLSVFVPLTGGLIAGFVLGFRQG